MQIEKRAGNAKAVVASDEYKQLDAMLEEFKKLTADAERFTIDETYDPASERAQSGVAVNEAFVKFANGLKGSPDLKYFDTLENIVTVINGGGVGGYLGTTEELSAGYVYLDADNVPNVVLTKDIGVSADINISAAMVLNLNGKHITLAQGAKFNVASGGKLKIYGKTEGSKITKTATSATVIEAIAYNRDTLEVVGGKYSVIVNTTTKNLVGFISMSATTKTYVRDAEVEVKLLGTMPSGSRASCIWSMGECEIDNCNLKISTESSMVFAVTNNGVSMKVSNTKMFADGRTGSTDSAPAFGLASCILSSKGDITIENSEAYGTHSGLDLKTNAYVKGGVYRGVAHGGIYFNGANTSTYVENASIESANYSGDYKSGYQYDENQINVSGFYVGSVSGMSVYLDNCRIVGGKQGALVLRGTDGEQNNSVYMSNCTIETDHKARIDNNTLKLYIGFGNNFTAEEIGLPEAVVAEPTKIYVKEG